MINTIYIEKAVAKHPKTQTIIEKLPKATLINCQYYGEIFNKKNQNFRLQKKNPALILAKKYTAHIMPTPENYGLGDKHNYYFSHMLNCLYDCRYCFLQGKFRSAHYVLFVNFEDFAEAIKKEVIRLHNKKLCFFAGYDCDSLALDHISDFTDFILPLFKTLPNTTLELRTKSNAVHSLLTMTPVDNCVLAYSLTPQEIAQKIEHKVPNIIKRLKSMQKLQRAGWPIGLRFDPLIYEYDYKKKYKTLFEDVFSILDSKTLHSITIGHFRLPKKYFKTLQTLYPEEKLFASPLTETNNLISYDAALKKNMYEFCREEILKYCAIDKIFSCDI